MIGLLRRLVERFGIYEVTIAIVWVGFVLFSVFEVPRIRDAYDAMGGRVPDYCTVAIVLAAIGPAFVPLPILFIARNPDGEGRHVAAILLVVVPIVVCAATYGHLFTRFVLSFD